MIVCSSFFRFWKQKEFVNLQQLCNMLYTITLVNLLRMKASRLVRNFRNILDQIYTVTRCPALACLASTLSHGDLRSISQTKDSNQSFLWRARSSSRAGETLGQMAHGQVDSKRKLFEEICFLISDLSCPCFFASAFCFCFFSYIAAESGKHLKLGNCWNPEGL